MRERLYQLTVSLALPVTVAAVWIVRGEPAGVVSRERATAYRVELAELPLPTPERLRAPRGASDWRGAQATASEDPSVRHRRAALPELAAPPPVALAAETGSEPDRSAGASPRVAQPELPLATRTNVLAPRPPELIVSTPLIVATRAGFESAREASPADGGRETVAAPESAPAAEGAAAAAAKPAYAALAVNPAPAAHTSAANPVLAASTSAAIPAPPVRAVAANAAPTVAAVRDEAYSAPPSAGVRDAAAPQRDHVPFGGQASSDGIDKTWREGVAAAPNSPALAHATREAKDALDLWLERGRSKGSPFEVALPLTTPPQLRSFASDPMPAASDRGVPETPLRAFDLPLPGPAAFARPGDDGAEEASPTFGSGSHRFLPVLAVLAIPEPGSAALLGAALAGLAAARRRERRA